MLLRYIRLFIYIDKPFYLSWNYGLKLIIFFLGGLPKVEEIGFGTIITTNIYDCEFPKQSADRLFLKEQIIRNSMGNSLRRSIRDFK